MEDKFSINGTTERQESSENNIFNLKWIITTLLAIWPWFLASMLVSYLLCNLYLRYTTPLYKMSGEIILNDAKGSTPSGDQVLLEGLGLSTSKSDVNNVIRILHSKTLMTRVVQALDLNVQYLLPGKVKMFEFYKDAPFKFVFVDTALSVKNASYKISFKDDENFTLSDGGKNISGKLGDVLQLPGGKLVVARNISRPVHNDNYIVNVSSIEKATGRFAGALDVSRIEKLSSSVEIDCNDQLPERGKDIINTLVKVYEQTNIEEKNRIANNTINFIDERLTTVGSDLTNIEKQIADFKESNNLTDLKQQAEELAKNSSKVTQDQSEKEVQLRILEDIENKYFGPGSNNEVALPALLVTDPTLLQMIGTYNALQGEKAKLITVTTKDNPYVLNIDAQLKAAKSKVLASIKSLEFSLRSNINELNRQSGIATGEIKKVPTQERIYLEYSRQQNIRQELYLYLLKKREEAAISKSATISNVLVVDKADLVMQIKPNRSKMITMSLFLGFFIPIVGLGMRRTFNTKIIAKADIQRFTDIPIVGEIGHSNDEISVAVKKNSNSILAEQFRSLRTNLQFLLTNRKDKVILLTSSMSGEGKSFIAINLASTFAISGKKVVLIELDLRRPKVSKNLGLDNGIGLSNYAIGQADLSQIIQKSGFEDNLYVISSGPIPPNPAELIMLPKMEEMFEELKKSFDFVIIDTAPIGLVTDAQLLGMYADTSLYVVRQGYTYKQQVQIANELKVNNKMPKMGLVINDVVFRRGYSYGYGYGYEAGYGNKYGYKYGYGYGYGYGSNGNGNGYSAESSINRLSLLRKLRRRKDQL